MRDAGITRPADEPTSASLDPSVGPSSLAAADSHLASDTSSHQVSPIGALPLTGGLGIGPPLPTRLATVLLPSAPELPDARCSSSSHLRVLLPIPPVEVAPAEPGGHALARRGVVAVATAVCCLSAAAAFLLPGSLRIVPREANPWRESGAEVEMVGAAEAPVPSRQSQPDLGRVMIGGVLPLGARITLDGRVLRERSVSVASGSYVVRLTAPGHRAVSHRLAVGPGETVMWSPRMPGVSNRARAAPIGPRAAVVTARAAARPESTIAALPPPPRPIALAATIVLPRAGPSTLLTCARALHARHWPSAARACEKDAQHGHVGAQRALGRLYALGLGVQTDRTRAGGWLRLAATAGDARAQYLLGTLLASGPKGRRDDREAVAWFRRAAWQGDPDAQVRLGIAYETGRGVNRDFAEAVAWFRRAAHNGHTWAQRRLGRLYTDGEGVVRNQREATK